MAIPSPETICIRTEKVYDFCFKNGSHPFTITGLAVPVDTAGVDCVLVGPVTCSELVDRRIRLPDGFAIVFVRKVATFDLVFLAADGTELLRVRRSRFIDEAVQICAPDGTDVRCEVRDALCRVTGFTDTSVSIMIDLCQLIQSTAAVKVCVPSLGFCLPTLCTQVEGKPFACPPEPLFPPQCPGVGPTCELTSP